MYDYSRQAPYVDYRSDAGLADRPAVLGKVMGLLGFAFLFTAGGALIGRSLGPGGGDQRVRPHHAHDARAQCQAGAYSAIL